MIIQDEKQLLGYDVAVSISNQLRKQIKGGEEADDGATFKPKGKELSRGCQEACKGGGWICIYLSRVCNRKCHFCPQYREAPNVGDDTWASLDDPPTIEKLKRYSLTLKDDIKGISFSGGEPFQQLERTPEGFPGIYEWLDAINEMKWNKKPYLWIYTNGDFVTEDNVTKLVDKGIQEIRFDLAASDYNSKTLKKMEMVRKKVDKLAVEVPVLGWQLDELIGSLKRLEDIGVDYLNLHELQMTLFNWDYLVSTGLVDYKLVYSISLDKISPDWKYYIPSLIDIYTVIRYIDDNNIDLIYNDCGSRNYRLQDISMSYLKLKTMKKDRKLETWEEHLENMKKVNWIP